MSFSPLFLDTSDQWIVQRTGIKQRHYISDDMKTSDMCTISANNALQSIDFDPDKLDLIIVATSTSDTLFPGCSHVTQKQIGATNAFAFDIQAACSGFVYALSVADQFIKTGQVNHALVIGADSMSKILNYQDRTTCILFGDGAGAMLLSSTNDHNRGIISTSLFSDGSLHDVLYTEGGIFSNKDKEYRVCMEGKKVFEQAVTNLSVLILTELKKHNISPDKISWVISHQANIRIIDAVSVKTKIAREKFLTTVEKHANTSAASIPLALSDHMSNNKISKTDSILMVAIGAGLTWGSILIKGSELGI